MRTYLNPAIDVIEVASEKGFCATIQFTPTTQDFPTNNSSSFGMDDMTGSSDNAGW